MNFDASVLDIIVMPKSNAYGGGSVSLRILANTHDYSRIKKFAKKVIEMKDNEYHLKYSRDLWKFYSDDSISNIKDKKDAYELSIIHYALSNTSDQFWH